MPDRSEMIAWIRGELVGPTRWLTDAEVIEFTNGEFVDTVPTRRGPLAWIPPSITQAQEVLYYDRESPHRKYGAGLLHPTSAYLTSIPAASEIAAHATDTLGVEPAPEEEIAGGALAEGEVEEDVGSDANEIEDSDSVDALDDFEVTSPDVRHPSTVGISFCVQLDGDGHIVVRIPQSRRFSWQSESAVPSPVNGRYERCKRRWTDDEGREHESDAWRRQHAVLDETVVSFDRAHLVAGEPILRDVTMPENSPIALRMDAFPRRVHGQDNVWLVTVVMRNVTHTPERREPRESVLYQTYFEVTVEGGKLQKYPESKRPFAELDAEEQSLALLYRESATWGIGHGCAAGWDAEPGDAARTVYADVFPAVQLPSMTPDIEDRQGNRIALSMRTLANLSDDGVGEGWQSLENLAGEYAAWIERSRNALNELTQDAPHLRPVGIAHLDRCAACRDRIAAGIELLKTNDLVRRAFRFANLAMLLQQIATKQLQRRSLAWNDSLRSITIEGEYDSPWNVYRDERESDQVGSWRAFQVAFLLMSLDGVRDSQTIAREVVDLIWFPTGGGKTEAYLAVMAFYMFHQRLISQGGPHDLRRDGTNVLMRYTLRMLTTQQFQRAASLICAMEFLRRNPNEHQMGDIAGERFSLGLWIGGDGSPNKIDEARIELRAFRKGDTEGNPLVLTECPWCRAEIGRYDGTRPTLRPPLTNATWNAMRVRGITDESTEGPLLHCADGRCEFGAEQTQRWLPVEVIDQRIYQRPPSLVIATADKLAIMAYRPEAGALFGRRIMDGESRQINRPPGLIIQDELHLISGPLGTMYALYEGIFERLCSFESNGGWIKPKLIASTATIRGAADQVKALYAREHIQLFPSPGIAMGDSFFGKYARDQEGRLRKGRLYLGIHASDYGSVLTTQVRTFSSALFRPFSLPQEQRDPWWTLLVFYNSIRELSGAKTLFDSDIRSRLKFLFNRENFGPQNRRNLRIVEELTSRLSQAEIVAMMDRLARRYSESESDEVLDACLASNIIEVGVDIDRLSLMGVVGQPKTTATYIQVTGRVGRRWWERPGLILMIYNPSKSRDRSHFEQFHSYHRRLYERVEPTSATPFAVSAIQRALPGALILWARQQSDAAVQNAGAYADGVEYGYELLRQRCENIQMPEDQARSLQELERVREELEHKWGSNPLEWEEFPQRMDGEYLMLWPGRFYTRLQKDRGVVVPSSMRQVDGSAELSITQAYALSEQAPNP